LRKLLPEFVRAVLKKVFDDASAPVPPAEYVIPGRTFDPSEAFALPTISGHKYYIALNGNDANPGRTRCPFATSRKVSMP